MLNKNSDIFFNMQRSGFEEIQSYQPSFYKEIKEMIANNYFSGLTIDQMAKDLNGIFFEQFIDTCSIESLQKYEKFLEIIPNKTDSIANRKAVAKMKWQGGGKISRSRIVALVYEYCQSKCTVTLTDSQLVIAMKFIDDPALYMPAIRSVINSSNIPAHIEILYKGDTGIVIKMIWKSATNIEKIHIRLSQSMYKTGRKVDGSALLDGCLLLDSANYWFPTKLHIPIYMKEPQEYFDVNNIIQIYYGSNLNFETITKIKNIFENISSVEIETLLKNISKQDITKVSNPTCGVIIKKNYHQIDGTLFLDGKTQVNSTIVKEDL